MRRSCTSTSRDVPNATEWPPRDPLRIIDCRAAAERGDPPARRRPHRPAGLYRSLERQPRHQGAASIRFLFVAPALCFRLPPDSQSPGTPLPSANTCPCQLCRELPPPSECVLPGAPSERPSLSRPIGSEQHPFLLCKSWDYEWHRLMIIRFGNGFIFEFEAAQDLAAWA